MSNGGTVDWEEVAKLGDALAEQDFRDGFAADPDGAMQRKGLHKEKIPATILAAFERPSDDDRLRKLVDVRDSLKDAHAPAFVFPRMV